jgi:catechol 2,3-dioxygenase-like lactoylglutathione lyase family enzyme
METTIATLLKDFEDGKMTRRQLIQSLAVLAMAGSAAAQTPARAERAPWNTVWLDHISYAVTDYKKSVAFYQNLMGWEIQNDNGTNQASMRIGKVGEIIIRNRRPPTQETQARPVPTGVINHISYGIEPWDTDKVKAELERRGLNPRPDMQGENFKSFHVLDPDGWDLQISNQTKLG